MPLTATELVRRAGDGALDVRAVVQESVEAAQRMGAELNAFVEVRPEAIEEAAAMQRSDEVPLAGVPVAVKDMFVDRDRPPTCGSNVGARWTKGTATMIERLRAAGAVIIGYTNLHEWGIGTRGSVSASGPIRNPHDRARVSGGSSSGSGAALAAGIVPLATGTDAGGSIRVPAACCGVVGFKPTWGAVPLDGFAEGTEGPPIDHAGPMARTVQDAQLLFEVMADRRVEQVPVEGLRVGIAREFFFDNADPDVAAGLDGFIDTLAPRVASVRDVVLEGAAVSQQVVPILLLTHTARLLENDVQTSPEAFQPESLNLLMLGLQMGENDIAQAEEMRRQVSDAWDRLFEEVDAVITPTIPVLPPAIGQDTVGLAGSQWSTELAFVSFNAPMNLGGVPALSLPCAEVDGWTVNATISAARGRDDIALGLGHLFEELTDGGFRNRVASG